MFIKIFPPKAFVSSKDSGGADFYLQQDNWNDFGFQTLYQLYLSEKYSTDNEAILIGSVKILKQGQKDSDGLLIPLGSIDAVSDKFCSLGQSLDYYERLANIDKELSGKLFTALRDIVICPKYKIPFVDEEGWGTSLFRDISENDDIFTLAPIMVSKDYTQLPSIDLSFDFNTNELELPILFSFNSPKYGYFDEEALPSRINVLIGRNGSGKSTLLSKLSRVAFASTSDRKDKVLTKVGEFKPEGLGFPKIVNISYSAFDSFQVPGIHIDEKEQINKDINNNSGRYIFCGIRDICKEWEAIKDKIKTDEGGKLHEKEILQDRQPYTHLKPIEQLACEFQNLITKIINENKGRLLTRAFRILAKEASLNELRKLSFEDLVAIKFADYFMELSTGHKFVLHSIANIVAHTEPRTLILFDEPETHLHPPLLAVLMSAIRYILDKKDAFAIVATHSPVVVQETLSRHVQIIKREGDILKIISPEIQTYGENIGLITSHVFGLSSEITDYHYELDKVIESLIQKNGDIKNRTKILEVIDELFDGEVSMQAKSYVLSEIASKQK